MVTELQDNSRYRLFEKFSKESTAIVIAGISLVVSTVFAIIAALAMDSANQANAIAETWQAKYSETERECRITQDYYSDVLIELGKLGIEINP